MALKHPRAYLENTSAEIARSDKTKPFFMVRYQPDAKSRYGEIISSSKFVLCPRGYACSTWRLFETMKAGRVPVIISDQWVAPEGPAWDNFSLRVMENQVSRIPEILEQYESQAELMGHCARAAWEEWFSKETIFHRIVEWCLTLNDRSHSYRFREVIPYLQLLRPFYVRHVLLPEMKHGLSNGIVGIHRFLSERFF